MSTILVVVALIAAVAVMASFVPGVKMLMEPAVKLVYALVGKLSEHALEWAIWAGKRLFQAHLNILTNLVSTREQLDPTEKVKKKQDQ